ncbi:CidA/LrgA family protein [Mobilitalea sibirica]|uniref:CidA/LrgA family protein n=1 Tax=Mobilitalea sibirica TaxID=1462919 RepID=A0A8J7H1P0_9FIRM|nr:CidA/LrgA family protein [Mobilitalea sibirica]MBH1940424.1 CidA/LrgA family protein [Mobilitalea sibirica]
MRLIKQFGIILAVTFIGELLHYIIPLPIPASIYGLVLMLIALKSRLIPLHKVKDAGSFLLEIMPMMFIPATVGLMVSWNSLRSILFPVLIITFITTIVVMAVTGCITQLIIRLEKRNSK